MAEAGITIILPRVLEPMTGGRRQFVVAGTTIGDALRALGEEVPALKGHLFNDGGHLRGNVLCEHEGTYIRRRDIDCHAVAPGDTIRIGNSIAGG